MEWADPEKDKEIASRLQKVISTRIAQENKNLDRANAKTASIQGKIDSKGSSEKLEKQLTEAKASAGSISTTISDLNNSSRELDIMGSEDVAQKFTFKELSAGSKLGGTYNKDGVITMEIVSDPNAVHEATHGYQMYEEGGITKAGRFDAEVSAYQRQFSFNPMSVTNNVPSEWDTVRSRSQINTNWVIGIHDGNEVYPYMPGLKRSQIIDL